MNSILRLARLGKAYLTISMPTHMVFFVTARCNARCPHCFYWDNIEKADARTELTPSEIENIARSLKGLVQISLTGGEPFLREDLAGIIKAFYKFSGTRFFTISTNGSLTDKIREVMDDVLPETPEAFYRISISVDDIGIAHDKKRGVEGLFEKVTGTVSMLNGMRTKYPNIAVNIVTTIDTENQGRLAEIHDHVKKHLNVDDWGVGVIRGDPNDKNLKGIDLKNYDNIYPVIKNACRAKSFITGALAKVMHYEHGVKSRIISEKKQVIPCVAGKRMVVLRESGEVLPCETIGAFLGADAILGNVRGAGYSIKKVLAKSNAKNLMRFIADKKCYCTYECALHCSIFYNPLELAKAFMKS